MGMIVSWMLVAAAIGAFAVTALSGCFVIPALHKLHFGQTIRESGPTWHNKKQGTPTMGGLCFIFGILVACGLVYAGFYRYAQDLLGIVQVRAALLALFLAFGSGFIGFLDDYIKVVKHRNLGLLAWQKLIMQFIVTGGFLVGLHMQGLLTTIIMLPFIAMSIEGSIMMKCLMIYIISGGIRILARFQWLIIIIPKAAMTMAFVKTIPDDIFMRSFSPCDAMRTKKEIKANP